MSVLDYLSRYVFWPLDNDIHGLGGIHRSVDAWLELFSEPQERIDELNSERLAQTLAYAFKHVPYYRELFKSIDLSSTFDSPGALKKIPYLDKRTIRNRPAEFLSDEIPVQKMIRSMTGGSTSEPMEFFRDRESHCLRWGLQYACNELIGWRRGEWYAMVWGAEQDMPTGDTLRNRLRNHLVDRRILLNAVRTSERSLADFINALRKYRPETIYGYPILLEYVCNWIAGNNVSAPLPKRIVVTAEKLTVTARRAISGVFNSEIIDRYACREFGVVSQQVPGSEFQRISPGSVWVEVAPFEESDPMYGELIITDLLNRAMPLIRYRTGDVGRLTRTVVNGVEGLYLSEIAGRTSDLLVSREGKIVSGTGVDPFFYEYIGFDQLQVIQKSLDEIIVRVRPNADYSEESERLIQEKIESVCGKGVSIDIQKVEKIERDPSGKFRIVISEVTPQFIQTEKASH